MIERDVKIINKLGLHARAAAKLVDCAAHFSSRIQVGRDNAYIDAKSIMSVMMLAAGQGALLSLRIDGRDEQAACDALIELIADRFGEPE